jgi:hypothetical protein
VKLKRLFRAHPRDQGASPPSIFAASRLYRQLGLENDRGRIEKEAINIALFSKFQPVNLNL